MLSAAAFPSIRQTVPPFGFAEIGLAKRGVFLFEVGVERHDGNFGLGGLDRVGDQWRVRRRDRNRHGVGLAQHVLDDLGLARLVRG